MWKQNVRETECQGNRMLGKRNVRETGGSETEWYGNESYGGMTVFRSGLPIRERKWWYENKKADNWA